MGLWAPPDGWVDDGSSFRGCPAGAEMDSAGGALSVAEDARAGQAAGLISLQSFSAP